MAAPCGLLLVEPDVLPRPRIVWWGKHPAVTLNAWRCSLLGPTLLMAGWGNTPTEAYECWLMRNGFTKPAPTQPEQPR